MCIKKVGSLSGGYLSPSLADPHSCFLGYSHQPSNIFYTLINLLSDPLFLILHSIFDVYVITMKNDTKHDVFVSNSIVVEFNFPAKTSYNIKITILFLNKYNTVTQLSH